MRIRDYPLEYRRAILKVLPPEQRAAAWRAAIADYIQRQPTLSDMHVNVLENAMARLSPEWFSPPLADQHYQEVDAIVNATHALLGAKATRELFYTLGPDNSSAALPLRLRLAEHIRTLFEARADPPCNCSMEWSYMCDEWGVPEGDQCSQANVSCSADVEWPMCGALWSYACDGTCRQNLAEGP